MPRHWKPFVLFVVIAMEVGDRRDAYSVLLFDADGKTSVYRNYTAR